MKLSFLQTDEIPHKGYGIPTDTGENSESFLPRLIGVIKAWGGFSYAWGSIGLPDRVTGNQAVMRRGCKRIPALAVTKRHQQRGTQCRSRRRCGRRMIWLFGCAYNLSSSASMRSNFTSAFWLKYTWTAGVIRLTNV